MSKYSRYICGGRNGCQSCSVLFHMESESELTNRIFGHPTASKKRGEIFVKLFFRLWMQFFLLGGVFHKCSNSNYHSILQIKFIGTHFVCEKTSPSCFLLFPPLCMPWFFKTFSFPNFWGVKKGPCISYFRWKLAEKSFIYKY